MAEGGAVPVMEIVWLEMEGLIDVIPGCRTIRYSFVRIEQGLCLF